MHVAVTAAHLLTLVAFLYVSAIQRGRLEETTRALAEEQAAANHITNAVMRQILAASYPLRPAGDRTRQQFETASLQAYSGIQQYLFRDLTVEERLQLEEVKEAHERLEVMAVRALELSGRGETAAASVAVDSVGAHALRLQSLLAAFLRMRERAPARLRERQAAVFRVLAFGTVGLMALWLTSSLFIGRFLERRVTRPLTMLDEAVTRIGAGEMDVRLPAWHDDEYATVARSFNTTMQRLREARDTLERRNTDLEDALESLRSTRDELIRSEKLGAVGRMVGGLAHELNNPLASVLGYAELLHRRLSESGRDGELEELVEPIVEEGKRARALIRNLLRFLRGSSGEPQPVDLVRALDVVVSLREYAVEQAGLTLEVEDMPQTWVIADRQRVQQVLLNVINNAIDAMAPRGQGTLSVSCIRSHDAVTLVLEDDGPGLEEPAEVFEAFYTTKPEDEGTGLGLALVRQFMEEFGGSAAAANRQDRSGARLLLTFVPSEAPAEEELERQAPEGGVEAPDVSLASRILVVEDEPALRRLQKRLLGMLGAEVLLASSEREAREVLCSEEVDVVVTDFRMPGGSGLDLYRWIASQLPELEARVLIVTGDVTDPELVSFVETRGDRVVHKPFEFEDYTRKIEGLLAER